MTPVEIIAKRLREYPYGGDNTAEDFIRVLADAGFVIVPRQETEQDTAVVNYASELHTAVGNMLSLQCPASPNYSHKYLPDTDATRAHLRLLESIVAKTPFGF